ncbi:hypothetical protein BDR07DRAFT_1321380 [Suillus spraguei]|nr:hypothetical protein BDR07DRAFT_1321380 [Suillus spraguei]
MATSNSPQTRPIAPYQQPSLPSIRQLHPYLPPSGMAQHLPPADPSAYTYPLQSPYSGPSGSSENSTTSLTAFPIWSFRNDGF